MGIGTINKYQLACVGASTGRHRGVVRGAMRLAATHCGAVAARRHSLLALTERLFVPRPLAFVNLVWRVVYSSLDLILFNDNLIRYVIVILYLLLYSLMNSLQLMPNLLNN